MADLKQVIKTAASLP